VRTGRIISPSISGGADGMVPALFLVGSAKIEPVSVLVNAGGIVSAAFSVTSGWTVPASV